LFNRKVPVKKNSHLLHLSYYVLDALKDRDHDRIINELGQKALTVKQGFPGKEEQRSHYEVSYLLRNTDVGEARV
jgi:hypothetical protein